MSNNAYVQENWLAALTYYISEKPIAYSQQCGFTSACQRTLRIKRTYTETERPGERVIWKRLSGAE